MSPISALEDFHAVELFRGVWGAIQKDNTGGACRPLVAECGRTDSAISGVESETPHAKKIIVKQLTWHRLSLGLSLRELDGYAGYLESGYWRDGGVERLSETAPLP